MALRHRLKRRFKKEKPSYVPKREAKRKGLWTISDDERGFHV